MNTKLSNACSEIASRIRDDICDRIGGDHWFDSYSKDIRREILSTWAQIIEKGLNDQHNNQPTPPETSK